MVTTSGEFAEWPQYFVDCPRRGKGFFSTPWFWAGFVTYFGQENAAEVRSSLDLGRFCMFLLLQFWYHHVNELDWPPGW